jgi:dolichol-phosphate mannosyltransferase
MKKRFLICLPTYNESANIVDFLSQLHKEIETCCQEDPELEIDILNIDDNSPDGTAVLARNTRGKRFHQIVREKKEGLGPAYLAGFKWGLEREYDFFIEMDADGSHHPVQLQRLIAACESFDLVIGTRWMPGGSVHNWPIHRRLISKLGTRYAAKALELPFKDLTSGFRVLDKDLVESLLEIGIHSKGYGFQVEMVLRARELGAAIAQVPITFTERTKGSSKMTFRIALEAFIGITKWGFSRRFRDPIRR